MSNLQGWFEGWINILSARELKLNISITFFFSFYVERFLTSAKFTLDFYFSDHITATII